MFEVLICYYFQTSARQLNISIDLLSWEFTPQSLVEQELVLHPEVIICS